MYVYSDIQLDILTFFVILLTFIPKYVTNKKIIETIETRVPLRGEFSSSEERNDFKRDLGNTLRDTITALPTNISLGIVTLSSFLQLSIQSAGPYKDKVLGLAIIYIICSIIFWKCNFSSKTNLKTSYIVSVLALLSVILVKSLKHFQII